MPCIGLSAAYVVMRCLSVRPSVCLSLLWIPSKRVTVSSTLLTIGSQTIPFFHTNCYGDFLTGIPVTETSNAGGEGKNHDSVDSFSCTMSCIGLSAASAVMRCLSVRPSVCLSRLWILSKRVIISSTCFHHR